MNGFHYLWSALSTSSARLGSDTISLAVRITLAALFTVAGQYKLRHPMIAAVTVRNFGLTPHPVRAAGAAVGLLELATAVLLLTPIRMLAIVGCIIAALMSASFTALIGRALYRHDRFPCHCLSGASESISVLTLWRAIAMAVGASLGIVALAHDRAISVTRAQAVVSVGWSALLAGIPLALWTAVSVWRGCRRYVGSIDWEWVLAVREGRAYGVNERGQSG